MIIKKFLQKIISCETSPKKKIIIMQFKHKKNHHYGTYYDKIHILSVKYN